MRVVVVYYSLYFSFFYFSTCIRSCTAPCFFPHAKYPRTADQNVTPVPKAHNTAERNNKAICFAQAALGIIKSLSAPNRGPLLSAPFTCFQLHSSLPCASVAGGVQPPASEALVCLYLLLRLLYDNIYRYLAFAWVNAVESSILSVK